MKNLESVKQAFAKTLEAHALNLEAGVPELDHFEFANYCSNMAVMIDELTPEDSEDGEDFLTELLDSSMDPVELACVLETASELTGIDVFDDLIKDIRDEDESSGYNLTLSLLSDSLSDMLDSIGEELGCMDIPEDRDIIKVKCVELIENFGTKGPAVISIIPQQSKSALYHDTLMTAVAVLFPDSKVLLDGADTEAEEGDTYIDSVIEFAMSIPDGEEECIYSKPKGVSDEDAELAVLIMSSMHPNLNITLAHS